MNSIHRINDIIKMVPDLKYDSGTGIFETDRRALYDFAELIIQEAASLTLNYKNESYYNGWLDYRDEIKRHFGIKDAPKT